MVKQKRFKMTYCNPSDMTVGIRGFCEKLDVKLFKDKVIINPIEKHSVFERMEEHLDKNLLRASDKTIEKELFPFVEDTPYDTLMTARSVKKNYEMEKKNDDIGYMFFLDELTPKEREKHLMEQYPQKPRTRMNIMKRYHQFESKRSKKGGY